MWRFVGLFVGLCASLAGAQTPPSNEQLENAASSELVFKYTVNENTACTLSGGPAIMFWVYGDTAREACDKWAAYRNTSSYMNCTGYGPASVIDFKRSPTSTDEQYYCQLGFYYQWNRQDARYIVGRWVNLNNSSVCREPRANFTSILDVAGMSSTCDVDAAGNKCWYRYNGAPTQTVTYYDYPMGSGVTCPEGQSCTKTVYYRYNVELTGAVCTTSAAQANESARQAVTERQQALGTAIDALENASSDGSTGGELKEQTDRVVDALGTVEVSVDGVKAALTSLQTVAEEIQRLAGKIDTNTAATSIATDAVQQAVGALQGEVQRIGADIVHAVQSQQAQSPDLSPVLSAMELARLGAAERTAALNKLVDEAAKAREEREKQTALLESMEHTARTGADVQTYGIAPFVIYTSGYPGGMEGIFQQHQQRWQSDPRLSFLHSFTLQYRSYAPQWTFDLGPYGQHVVAIPDYVTTGLYYFVLVAASSYALRIIFGR